MFIKQTSELRYLAATWESDSATKGFLLHRLYSVSLMLTGYTSVPPVLSGSFLRGQQIPSLRGDSDRDQETIAFKSWNTQGSASVCGG